MERKIKVVLLCQYWSDEMASMVGRKHYFRELSPWIQETLNLFKNKNDVEYHVVAPNYASNKNLDCERDCIRYHFYHYSPTWLSVITAPLVKLFIQHSETYKIAERFANTLTGFQISRKYASQIIRRIKPDLIHLYGSENPDYAAPAICLMNEFPFLLTIQGYAYLQTPSTFFLERLYFNHRVKFERQINEFVQYLTTVSKDDTINTIKCNDVNFFFNCKALYYVTAITKVPPIDASAFEKKYDLVYYARIDRNKGVEDLIEAVDFLKGKGRLLRTLIMGRGSDAYVSKLKETIKEKGIDDIIDFAGFIERHEDVYNLASQARLMVLPTHNDGIPNTIREAMFMKLPVVASNVGGIPSFNEKRHCIHLIQPNDLVSLSEGICQVLDDEEYRNELIENSFQEAQETYSPDAVYNQTLSAYKDVAFRTRSQNECNLIPSN